MIYKLILKSRAENDLAESIEWYESQQKGLGKRFIEQIDLYFDKIQKNPMNFPMKRKPFREAYIRSFPYIIIYELIATEIIVYSIFHSSRDPLQKP